MDRSPPESSRPEGFFRCRDAGETLSRMKIRSSLILGVALQFGSITFAQDHKIEVTGTVPGSCSGRRLISKLLKS